MSAISLKSPQSLFFSAPRRLGKEKSASADSKEATGMSPLPRNLLGKISKNRQVSEAWSHAVPRKRSVFELFPS